MKFFTNIFQEFWSHILEHLLFQTPLTRCFRCTYLCILYRLIMALQCVIHYPYLKTTKKSIPLNQHKFQILNQNKEVEFGGENAHEHQSKSIPPSFSLSKYGAHAECYKKFLASSIAKRNYEGEGTSTFDNTKSVKIRGMCKIIIS